MSPITEKREPAGGTRLRLQPAGDEAPSRCGHCGDPIEQPRVGRTKAYCSEACRNTAWRRRHGVKKRDLSRNR